MNLPFPRPLRRRLRLACRAFLRSRLRLIYHEKYNLTLQDVPNDPLRAERILAFLVSEGLVEGRDVRHPEPVWIKALSKVHSADYLDSLVRREVVTSIMGSDHSQAQIDRLVDLQRLQTGGTLMAVRGALRTGLCAHLGGGFHHAHADMGGGFCLFNDVAAAIRDERDKGFDGRVLVVDLDIHDGDGTRSIFREDSSVHTFSVHSRHWDDTDGVESTSIELGSKVDDAAYLGCLQETLPPLFERFRPRLVIYLAGCDPAHDDRLGSWSISADGMLARDRLVAGLVEKRRRGKRPALAIVLAGGYSQNSWRYSARFLAWLELGHRLEPPETEEITLRRYRYLATFLEANELSGGDDSNIFGITEEDLALPGWSGRKETRFLGYYTRHAIELVLERLGFLDRLRDMGYPHPSLEILIEGSAGDSLRIFGEPEKERLLAELRVRHDRQTLPGFELLGVEWLLMQNPRAVFSAERPPLPGQAHPGLRLLPDVVALLLLVCDRLHLDGLVFVPSRFHIAAYGRSHMTFIDAKIQARFRAMLDFFADTPFLEAATAVDEGRLLDADTGEVVAWEPSPMVLAGSKRLDELVRQRVQEAKTYPPPRFRLKPIAGD